MSQIVSAVENCQKEVFVHGEVVFVKLHSQAYNCVDQGFETLLDPDVLRLFIVGTCQGCTVLSLVVSLVLNLVPG